MAKFAYTTPYGVNGKRVDAAELPIYARSEYYCTTPGCCARMFLRAAQKSSAAFVTYKDAKHTGGYNCQWKHNFNPDHYNEKLFNLNDFFDNAFNNTAAHDAASRNGVGSTGRGQAIAVNSLKQLFCACIHNRETGNYNGYAIDDILVDAQSSADVLPIIGRRIVVCALDHYYKKELRIQMKLSIENRAHHVNLLLHGEEIFNKLAQKLYVSQTEYHRGHRLFVILGEWKTDVNNVPTCYINSISKQICKPY